MATLHPFSTFKVYIHPSCNSASAVNIFSLVSHFLLLPIKINFSSPYCKENVCVLKKKFMESLYYEKN